MVAYAQIHSVGQALCALATAVVLFVILAILVHKGKL